MAPEPAEPAPALRLTDLPDELLARVLRQAAAPVPFPWDSRVGGVCRDLRRVCLARRRRDWYLEHSSLAAGSDRP